MTCNDMLIERKKTNYFNANLVYVRVSHNHTHSHTHTRKVEITTTISKGKM